MTWLLLPVPVIYAAIDITENLIIESIFSSASIDPHLVAVASTLTILKFVFFVASLLTALIVLLIKPKNIKDNSRR